MRAIIIGAGRGSRLMPTTANSPKCFAEVGGQRILDWTLDALRQNDIDDITFIGGYRIESVQEAYPEFTFRHNKDWANNNILASLFYAEDRMDGPFICCYSDILFTSEIVQNLIAAENDINLSIDTDWLSRYEHRHEHPSDDAEKVAVENGEVVRIHREIAESDAHGEYTGVARFSSNGAQTLREYYHRSKKKYAGQPFREAKLFEKAYLIHLFQEMLEAGIDIKHVDSPGGYIEIDTQEDFEFARTHWTHWIQGASS